jgi:phosphoglycolate phosphatase
MTESPQALTELPRFVDDFDAIIFDLDGTLWDASAVSAAAWDEAFSQLGLQHRITAQDVRRVSGLPFETCVATLCPEPSDVSMEALIRILDGVEKLAFQRTGGRLYDEVSQGIRLLASQYPLFIVSNCQTWYLESFLDVTGLRDCFRDYESHGRTGQPKSENIAAVVRRNGLENPVYIGDTAGDQAAAADSGVAFIHARYGFGRVEEPCRSFSSFAELTAYFTTQRS